MIVPTCWQATLLALAVYRTTRLIGWDDVTARLRLFLVGRGPPPNPKRLWMFELLGCPFCLSWWVALGWWGGFEWNATGSTGLAVPFALSAVTGLIAKHLDA